LHTKNLCIIIENIIAKCALFLGRKEEEWQNKESYKKQGRIYMKKATLFSSLMPRANKEVYKFWTRSKTNSQHLVKEVISFLIAV